MKLRKLFLVIAFFTLMTVIWCMIPPKNDPVSVIAEIILTVIIILIYILQYTAKYTRKFLRLCTNVLRRFVRACAKEFVRLVLFLLRPVKALFCLLGKILDSDPVCRFFLACEDKVNQFNRFLGQWAMKFAGWSFQADPELVREKRRAITKELGYNRQPRHPLYRTKLWCNLMNAFCFVAMTTTHLVFVNHYNLLMLIVLFLFNIVLLCFIITITDLTTTMEDNLQITKPTDPSMGTSYIILQFFVSLIALAYTLLTLLATTPNTPEFPSFDRPYFTIQLSTISFTLTVPQAIIIVSTILFLVCYSNLCVAAHDIANWPESQS